MHHLVHCHKVHFLLRQHPFNSLQRIARILYDTTTTLWHQNVYTRADDTKAVMMMMRPEAGCSIIYHTIKYCAQLTFLSLHACVWGTAPLYYSMHELSALSSEVSKGAVHESTKPFGVAFIHHAHKARDCSCISVLSSVIVSQKIAHASENSRYLEKQFHDTLDEVRVRFILQKQELLELIVDMPFALQNFQCVSHSLVYSPRRSHSSVVRL
jgi:hypothetical protein